MGFLANDVGASVMDPSSGTLTGAITDYVQYAVECLGKQELTFTLMGYNSYEEEIEALKAGEIDMIFSFLSASKCDGEISFRMYKYNMDI